MLTLVRQEEKDSKNTKQSQSLNYINVVSFTQKVKTNEKSQKNVLAAAKKLKW